jgi:hypothetical protein
MTVNSAESAFQSYFSERGIRPETVAANRIQLSPPDETYKAVKALLPAIRWDYGNGYRRYRFLGDPDTFPKNEKGQPVKAKAVKGSGNRLYIPVRPGQSPEQLNAAKEDISIPIAIVEGEADTLGVLQAEPNALVVGISGCWGWKSKKDPILPELRALAKPGRVAVLCPDSDWAVNPKVFQGWLALGTVLKQLGCNVQVVAIKSDSGKLGAGDYIHKFGAETWTGLPRTPLGQWESQGNEIHRAKTKKAEAEADGVTRGGGSSQRKSLSTKLVELALEMGSLWHDSAGRGWIDFTVGGVLQTARIRSKRFQDYLSNALWQRYRCCPSSEAWSQAMKSLEGQARDEGSPEREAFLRVAKHEGSLYIDLGTKDWQIVRVSADGWEIIPYSDCPVRFHRPECQLPLPIPTRGGSLDDLWRLLNFKEPDRPLVLGWLLSCLTPDGAKPILALSGAKGSGKSSAAQLLKRLTDPTDVSLGGSAVDQRQFAVSAANRWVLCFDNLTHLSTEEQNLLCRASTGGGFTYRALYSDLEEVSVKYRRPQILTGVDLVPTRGDLLDRCLIVRLERIPDESRLPEAELEALTAKLLPGIYGALLDLLATALRNLPTTKPAKLPRMADFAQLCMAAGIPNFEEVYGKNIEVGCQEAVEANPITSGILSLLDAHDGHWQGSSTELIRRMQELDPTNREIQKLSARSLGKKLASSLRGELEAVGVKVDQGKGSRGQRYLTLSRVAKEQPAESQGHPPSIQQGNEATGEMTNGQTPTDPAPEQHKGSAGGSKDPVAVNGQRVRFLDRDPIPPPLRGREAQLERETYRTAVVWIGGKRQRVPKDWLVEGSFGPSMSQNGTLPSRTEGGSATSISTTGNTDTRAQLGRSDKPQSTTNGSPTTSSTGMSKAQQPQKQSVDDPVIDDGWNKLLGACCDAGVSHLQIRQVLSDATGIPKKLVGTVPLTRSQYRRVMDYLANYRGKEGSPT